MLGLYAAVSLSEAFAGIGPLGWWGGGAARGRSSSPSLGALIEIVLLRRLYGAPELYQLLATFALVLVIRDVALWIWGSEDLLGPQGAGDEGRGRGGRASSFPSYDVFSIFVGPLVLGALWLLLTRTRWGLLVRAATQDREMVGALGVNQRWLFTSVFALGTFLAALGGALQMPHEPANLNLDLALIGEAFVVVVVGGMGSIPGAFVAAVLIADGQGVLHRRRLDRSVRRAVSAQQADARRRVPGDGGGAGLAARGDCSASRRGRCAARRRWSSRCGRCPRSGGGPAGRRWRRSCCVAFLNGPAPYAVVLMIDVLIAVLFAASLHFLMGPAGMHSFGHAAYFGLGAYGAALCVKALGLPMEASLLLAPLLAAARRLRLRLVLRAPLGRLPGDADARLRADRLVGRVPVGRAHRRQQRPGRHLAGRVAGAQARVLPAGAGLHRRRRRPAGADAARAVRPGAARQPRFADPRRGDRHRRAAPAVGGVRRRRHDRRAGRRRCSPSPRARSRPRRSASPSRSTAW